MLYSIQQYQAAQETFYSKYEDLPGDMTDAYDYWGSACNSTDTKCNGDGDGDIELSGTADDNEVFRLWQHLVLSELLDEGFDGEGNGTGDQADPGVNVPVSARTKVGFAIIYGNIDGGTSRNEIRIGAFQANALLGNSALSPRRVRISFMGRCSNSSETEQPMPGMLLTREAGTTA